MLHDEGTSVVKVFLHISNEEQRRRLQARIDDPAKNWKFQKSDIEARRQWDQYQERYEEAITETSTDWAPWYVVRSDDKRRARLNCITHLLRQIPYKKVRRDKVKLPKRQKPHGYREPNYPFKFVPEKS